MIEVEKPPACQGIGSAQAEALAPELSPRGSRYPHDAEVASDHSGCCGERRSLSARLWAAPDRGDATVAPGIRSTPSSSIGNSQSREQFRYQDADLLTDLSGRGSVRAI